MGHEDYFKIDSGFVWMFFNVFLCCNSVMQSDFKLMQVSNINICYLLRISWDFFYLSDYRYPAQSM